MELHVPTDVLPLFCRFVTGIAAGGPQAIALALPTLDSIFRCFIRTRPQHAATKITNCPELAKFSSRHQDKHVRQALTPAGYKEVRT